MMVFSKLSTWLREAGVDRSTIGGLYAVSLAYSLKMLWAPLVDRFKLPLIGGVMGQRRSWMLLAIVGTVIGLVTIATSEPAVSLTQTVIGALILAFSGATLDISVDAWRIESAPNDEQANMAAIYNLGYRFAIMFAGYGIALADVTSWFFAYCVMAFVMSVLAGVVIFLVREPDHEKRTDEAGKPFRTERPLTQLFCPSTQIIVRLGVWFIPVIAIVALYRISDFTMGVMASPFYIDLGYTKATIGLIQGTFGPWPIVVGGFLGGFVAVRYSLLPALLFGGVITILTNGAFATLALAAGPGLDAGRQRRCGVWWFTPRLQAPFLVSSSLTIWQQVMSDRFSSPICRRWPTAKFAATQYAVLSSTYSIFCKMMASTTSGPLSEAIGWAGFFTVTALYTIIPMASDHLRHDVRIR